MEAKKIAILTRSVTPLILGDNPIYQNPLYDKVVFASECHLTPKQLDIFQQEHRLKV